MKRLCFKESKYTSNLDSGIGPKVSSSDTETFCDC